MTGVECVEGAQASLHPRPSLFYLNPEMDGGVEFVAATYPPHSPAQERTIPMLKLHASVSKKVGLPGFSSASASCTIEAELDGSLLHDHEGFQIVVKRAYQSCEKAVEDQIARLLVQGNRTPKSPVRTHPVHKRPADAQPEPFSRMPAVRTGSHRGPHEPNYQRHSDHDHEQQPSQSSSRYRESGARSPGYLCKTEVRPRGPAA